MAGKKADESQLIIDNFFTQCTDYIDKHIKEFRYAAYGLGIIGLGITIRSLRVFGRFHSVERIPKDYFKKNMNLDGIVRSVDTDNGTLLVEHIPILQLFKANPKDPLLRVRLSGVRVTSMGTQWLRTTTENDRIRITLLSLNADREAESIVTSMEGFLKKRCINSEVIRLGMGQVEKQSETLGRNKKYRKLYLELLRAEADAAKYRRGIWFVPTSSSSRSSSFDPMSLMYDVSKTVLNKIRDSMPKKPTV